MAFHRPLLPPACERAHVWVSQELDDELSELELAALRAHLEACAACDAFARSARALTTELRAAPLLEPSWAPALPTRAGRRLRLVAAAAVAAVAAAVAIGAGVGSLTRGGPGSAQPHSTRAAIAATQQPYVEQSLLAMLAHLKPQSGRTVAV